MCRYGDVYNVSSLCASYSAMIPKLNSIYADQKMHENSKNNLRYLRTGELLTVFLFKKNLVFICVSKNFASYFWIQRILEHLHTQAFCI